MSIAMRETMINSHSRRGRLTIRIRVAVNALARTLRIWRARLRERQAVLVIDERDLRDLGVSRWEVERELSKPFWRG